MQGKKMGPRLKGALVVLALVVSVAATAFVAAVGPGYSLTRVGTYLSTIQRYDSLKNGQAGCYATEIFNAGDSEWVGNIAYLGPTINTIKTDTILTNYNTVAGVVIGGQRSNMLSYADSISIGTLVATAGQKVILCTGGRVWTTHDTTAAALPGAVIIPSNRQGQRGRWGVKTTAIDSFYRAIGKTLDSAGANTARRTLIRLTIK